MRTCKQVRLLFVLLLSMLVLNGCNGSGKSGSNPMPTPIPTNQTGFSENFDGVYPLSSSPESWDSDRGWNVSPKGSEDSWTIIADGYYYKYNKNDYALQFSGENPSFLINNFTTNNYPLEVKIKLKDYSVNSTSFYGVVVGYINANRWYSVGVELRPNKPARLIIAKQPDNEEIPEYGLPTPKSILFDSCDLSQYNILHISFIGNGISASFKSSDEKTGTIVSWKDENESSEQPGKIGLVVMPGENSNLSVVFDDFTKPSYLN
ncbi:MAG TPA: hypothetical protein VEC37_13020 [Bacillota bacterium]|nr:hypothetical protein [Bacillota bacterium]